METIFWLSFWLLCCNHHVTTSALHYFMITFFFQPTSHIQYHTSPPYTTPGYNDPVWKRSIGFLFAYFVVTVQKDGAVIARTRIPLADFFTDEEHNKSTSGPKNLRKYMLYGKYEYNHWFAILFIHLLYKVMTSFFGGVYSMLRNFA